MKKRYPLKALAAGIEALFLLALCKVAVAEAEEDTGRASSAEVARLSLSRRPRLPPPVRVAILLAYRKLEDPRCRQIFGDFRDSSGGTLQERLDAIGQTGQSYLAWMFFYDGTGARPCSSPETLAMTAPGSRVVFFCGAKFAALLRRDSSTLSTAILHEELHSLGLGENPPKSEEISRWVVHRCR